MKKTLQQAKAFRDACINNGYLPVPIWNVNEVDSKGKIKNGKEPVAFDWVKIATAGKLPASSPKQTNTGIALPDLYAIDVDIEDEAIASEIEKLIQFRLGNLELKRFRSNSHRFLTLFRSEGGITRQYVNQNSSKEKVEILSDGRQFVADGWHESGVEIEWVNGISPANFPKADLPLITQDMMKAFLIDVKNLFDSDKFTIHGFNEPKQTSSNLDNSSALENEPIDFEDLKDWLHHLDGESDYDSWVKIIGAIFNTTNGSKEGFELADNWSKKKANNYDEKGMKDKWDSFSTSPMHQLNGHFILKKLLKQTPKYHSPSIQKSEKTFSDNFKVRDGKLWFVLKSDDGDEYKYVSDAFDYSGQCQTKGNGWAHLISWTDKKGILHNFKIPFSELGDEQTDIFKKLRDGGMLGIDTRERKNLFKKFLGEQETTRIIEISRKAGWYNHSYLCQDGMKFGNDDVALDVPNTGLIMSGGLDEWKDQVAKYTSGNVHLMFSICVALAGPLLDIANIDGGGFHFYGKSKTGKTSAIEIAASVLAGPGGKKSWRATDNGLESVAASFNDATLFLDEIGQLPERVSPVDLTYLLANGMTKQRSSKDSTARETPTWKLIYLSAGEHDLAAEAANKSKQLKAGNLTRHIDIPMESLGIRNLHGFPGPREVIDAMRHAAKRLYGAAGRAFLARLVDWRVKDEDALQAALAAFIERFITECAHGMGEQVIYVATKFALVAAAGEWAIEWGVLPWQTGEAWEAAKYCFAAHLSHRGHAGAHEDEAGVDRVKAFIQINQYSRFKNEDHEDGKSIYNCAGEINRDGNFLIYPHVFQDEICKGNDAKSIASILFDKCFLDKGNDKYRYTKKVRVGGKTQWFYVILKSILEDETISIVRAA